MSALVAAVFTMQCALSSAPRKQVIADIGRPMYHFYLFAVAP